MKVQGSCHCGQIAYEAEVDPEKVSLCNCKDCQMLTGTGFRVSVPVLSGTLRMLSGTPKPYVKTADSGNKRRHTFCPNCGTPVYSSDNVDKPERYALRVGCLKQSALLPPKKRIWCKSALAWAQNVSGLPGEERQ
jgi:hypothetical protein